MWYVHKAHSRDGPLTLPADYGNEQEAGEGVARAIKDGLVKREELFLVSKLWNSFHDQEHVKPICKKQLKDWGVGKEIDVGLGVDRDVEAEREKLADERTTEGVFSKDTVYTRGFRVTMRNHRTRAIDVRLLDQLPVSNDEELKVTMNKTSLPLARLADRDAETNKARGVLEWRFNLPPKSDQEIRFDFEVRHPKGMDVSGLGE